MCLENKKKIKTISEVIVSVLSILFVIPPLLNRKTTLMGNLPDWALNHSFEKIVGTVLLYAVFRFWLDDFFKKKWSERDYSPVIVILSIVSILLLY
jgi:UDP-N-acetylmuramyl pentapeptide phosphotransferase/UDP-N-acetylglucosamine-1-phosphate transferase